MCPAMPDEAPRERDARGVDDARAYCALSDDDDPGTGEGEGAGEVRGARGGGRGQSPWQMRPWRVLQARGGIREAGAGAGESRERVGRGDRAVDAELARVRELWRKASQAEGV